MTPKLELVREEKLYRLIPGKKKSSRLEASGVALVDDTTAAVIFDNLNLIARIDLSLEPSKSNQLFPAPSLADGRLYLRDFDEIVSLDVRGDVSKTPEEKAP